MLSAAVLAVVDRVGARVAARVVASELQRSADLGELPDVEVEGIPFLTQALDGHYRSIDVRAQQVPVPGAGARGTGARGLVLRTMSARLEGVHVPLSAALSGRVDEVPVNRVDATVVLAYADLSRRSAESELTVSPAGDRVRVSGRVRVLGQDLTASALGRLSVDRGAVVVTTESFDVGGGVADRLVTRALRGRFNLRIPLGALPFGLQVQDVRVREDGLAVRATADDTVLTSAAASSRG